VVEKKQLDDNFDQLPVNELSIADQLKNIHNSINIHERNKMYTYCLLGKNLKELKRRKRGEVFIEFVKAYLPTKIYGRSYIYFLIALYEFASKHKKLMDVTLGISTIRSKFKYIRDMIDANQKDWQ